MKYNVTIGLEMHCEISKTNTKVFSSARNGYSEIPNSNIQPVDMGFPGTLPVLNKECVRMALMMSEILHCKQPEYMYFERKNYYYPDLPKGYQITQNTPPAPVGMDGYIDIERNDGSKFRVLIDNIHLEEDAASMTHLYDISTINYNRAGVPLLELVTKPCLHSAEDAVTFLEYMRSVYQYCDISEADSKKGQIRCDVNVSISENEELGTKVEIKNVNSFGGVKEAIKYEIKRQTELKENGRYEEVEQETRRYDEESNTTIRMRSKVDAIDYKYFIEPNIPKFKISSDWLTKIKESIPKLPYERKGVYQNEYGLSSYDAGVIVKEKKIADYFEKCLNENMDAKTAANWLTGPILGYLSKNEMDINDLFITPQKLFSLTEEIRKGNISSKQGKELFYEAIEEKKDPLVIMKEKNMVQISDEETLTKLIDEILSENTKQIEMYHNGKTNMFDYFVGQAMKKTKGQANPVKVKEILITKLNN